MATPVKVLPKRILGVLLNTKGSTMIARLNSAIIGLGIITPRRDGISLKTRLNSWEGLMCLLMWGIPMRGWMCWGWRVVLMQENDLMN